MDYVFDPAALAALAKERAAGYAAADPYPHAVFDDFLRPDAAALHFPLVEELTALPQPVVVGPLQALSGSVAANYAEVHVVDDFALFTASLGAAGWAPASIRRFSARR